MKKKVKRRSIDPHVWFAMQMQRMVQASRRTKVRPLPKARKR